MGRPLTTSEGLSLLRAVRTGGVQSIVFAGGDPTLRSDLPDLLAFARSIGLEAVIHTNAHEMDEAFWTAVPQCDHLGLSIDGPDASTHDRIRGREGNFSKVIGALERCSSEEIPVSVRTVVAAPNRVRVPEIGRVLEQYSCVKTWKLLEFSAVEGGYRNKDLYSISANTFEEVYEQCRSAYPSLRVTSLRTAEKVGAYMMISPNGGVYGVTQSESIDGGKHRKIGTIMHSHLSWLADALHIVPEKHAKHLRVLTDV